MDAKRVCKHFELKQLDVFKKKKKKKKKELDPGEFL